MTAMLDKVALAMFNAWNSPVSEYDKEIWAATRPDYLVIARAAVLAIREVDQETYNAGWNAMSGDPDAGPGEPWLAMIDHILSEMQP